MLSILQYYKTAWELGHPDQTLDFWERNEDGATATEYIVLLVFIALAIIIGATALGTTINGRFERVSTSIP
jgi:pilus assembly protein Flp/PilA